MSYYYRLSIMGAEHKEYPVKSEEPIDLSRQPRAEGKDVDICEIAKETYESMMAAARPE